MREKTNITLHPEVKKAAQALADGQQRSLSELVERLLEREVERHGQAPRFYMSEQPAAYGQQSSHSAAAVQGWSHFSWIQNQLGDGKTVPFFVG